MTVTLLHNSPLYLAAHGARTCWDSHDKSDTIAIGLCPNCESTNYEFFPQPQDFYKCHSCQAEFSSPGYRKDCGPADTALVDRVGNKFKHASILEHLNYTFFIEGISRACLQELSRHRHTSPSVKSSRYTLTELRNADDLTIYRIRGIEDHSLYTTALWLNCEAFLVKSGNEHVDLASCKALIELQKILKHGTSNDYAKYCMPESYKVTEQLTVNARSLQNFLSLRSDKSALWEIQQLAHAIFAAIPDDHKYLFEDHLKH